LAQDVSWANEVEWEREREKVLSLVEDFIKIRKREKTNELAMTSFNSFDSSL